MAEQLFALKRDVNELMEDMQQIKRSYNTVDFIAHTVKNLWDEQQCQAAQMRRIEERLDKVEEGMRILRERMDRIEERLNALEVNMEKIVKHLGIQ